MTESVTQSLLAAAGLVDDLEGQRRREADSFDCGYRLGFAAGREVGRMQLDRELAEQDRRRAGHVHDVAEAPAYAELERRRAAPSGPAYFAAVMRNGGTEFGGIGRPRVAVAPDVLSTATAWLDREVERNARAAA